MLVDIVSKNGNMLLSVPVRSNGTIDEKEVAILNDIKAWMDVNSVSIYGTRPWKTFGEGPLAEANIPINAQGFNESNNYSAADIRFVERNDTVFATTLRYPESDKVIIKSFGAASKYYSGEVKTVKLLGYGDVEFKNGVGGLEITMPEQKVNDIAAVFVVEFDKNAPVANYDELAAYYQTQISALRPLAGTGTGKYDSARLDAFAEMLKGGKADNATVSALNEAYSDLVESGHEKVVVDPSADGAEDVTAKYLVESKDFSRKADISTRFAAPAHWTVENFNIPNGGDGVKNGLDKYTGKESLMLGVWNDRNRSRANLSNARIYRTVKLAPGRYFFGATYNAVYSLSPEAYIFASTSVLSTGEIPAKSIAYSHLGSSAADGKCYGISFTLQQEQDVVLGFQVNLALGSNTQEFRAESVKLLRFE
jgi:alpha-L-fucosidase